MTYRVFTGHVYGIGISVPVGECEGKAFEPVSVKINYVVSKYMILITFWGQHGHWNFKLF